jgi:alcohol dehydrogenase class IV
MRRATEIPRSPGPVTLIGPGINRAVPDTAAELRRTPVSALHATVVTGPGFRGRPWSDRVMAALRPMRTRHIVHSGATTPGSVLRLVDTLRSDPADVVVAIGGGTVLDAVKAAVALAGSVVHDEIDVVAACTGAPGGGSPSVHETQPTVVAVPTTPGTGTEVTPFATIWDPAGVRKLSLSGPHLVPDVAVLDPDLLVGLDSTKLTCAALDSLCQGAEAAWSIRSTRTSIVAGLSAIFLVAGVLDRIAEGELHPADRLCLLLGGHHSGRAIAEAPTSSCHALSYPLTMWLGLPHGHACGVSLARMLHYNAQVTVEDCADPRGATHVRNVVHRIAEGLAAPQDGPLDIEHTTRRAAARVELLLADNGLASFDDLPVSAHKLATEATRYPRLHDNPRRLTVAALTKLVDTPLASEETCS